MRQNDLEWGVSALGELLASRGQAYRVVAIGGGSLLLLGLLTRPTNDLDLISVTPGRPADGDASMPAALQSAVEDVARAIDLPRDWLNLGPASLRDLGLPGGFDARLETHRYGSLEVDIASRLDQVHFKLYAAVDQGPRSKHMADLRALSPTSAELVRAARWARTHDTSAAFRVELGALLRTFDVEFDSGRE